MKNIFNKKNIVIILVYFLVLFILRSIITHEAKHIAETVMLFMGIISVMIWGYKALYFATLIYGSIAVHFNKFYLYPTLLFLTIATLYNRRYIILAAVIYHLNTITAFCFDPEAVNINVIIFYSVSILLFIILYNLPLITEKRLTLTADEIMLLNEWCEKELLKACECFSKNIKTEKLKRARERNNLKSNEELKAIYLINRDTNRIIQI